tara:strand:+ start:2261 stop:3511 length:1251 start_codon:yes stop_codon:yes gene_type:complete
MKSNYKTIIILLLSIISCSLAQGLTIISIPWHFTDVLNSSSQFSLAYAIITFIGVFWGLYAGVIIDCYNRKKILLHINLISAFTFMLIAVCEIYFNIQSHFLILLGFAICSFYYTIFFPNLYAMAQELSDKKKYVRINSYIEVFFQITSICSALLCGILLSGSNTIFNYFNITTMQFRAWNIEEIFILNSTLYLVTFILLLNINYRSSKIDKLPNLSKLFEDVRKAIFFFKKNTRVLIYGICSQIIFAFLIVELFTLLPLFVKKCLNENIIIFSLADVTYGLGAVIAGLLIGKLIEKNDKISLTIFFILLTGYAFYVMISYLNLKVFFITTLMIGMTNAGTRVTRMTYFFEKIPNKLIGRTNTLFNTVNTLVRVMFILIFSIPWFEQGTNVIYGYKIGIILLIVFAMPLIFDKRLN